MLKNGQLLKQIVYFEKIVSFLILRNTKDACAVFSNAVSIHTHQNLCGNWQAKSKQDRNV